MLRAAIALSAGAAHIQQSVGRHDGWHCGRDEQINEPLATPANYYVNCTTQSSLAALRGQLGGGQFFVYLPLMMRYIG